ncbi:hypothetical protein [Arcanobacterium hippocoleae]|uniref:hypothetical protein n=1 Tax=Arcanobacterium hippocoleae TaxID=149017 RepID=UPI00333F6949
MQKPHKLKKLLVCLLPALLFLTACDSHNKIVIEEGGSAAIEMQIKDDSGTLGATGVTCDSFKDEIGADKLASMNDGEIEIKDNSKDGNLDCMIIAKSTGSKVDGKTLIEQGDNYIFTIPGGTAGELGEDDLKMLSFIDFDFSLTVQMPGTVVRADGAEISGNTAVFTDIAAVIKGIEVEGKKVADGSSAAAAPKKDPKSENSSATANKAATSGSFPWMTVGVIGIIFVLAVIVLIAVIAIFAKRNKNNSSVNPYAGNYPGANTFQNGYQPQGGYQPGAVNQGTYGQGTAAQTAFGQQTPMPSQGGFAQGAAAQEFFSAPAPAPAAGGQYQTPQTPQAQPAQPSQGAVPPPANGMHNSAFGSEQ